MKTIFLLLLAVLAIKSTTTTSAVGQEACTKAYIACLDKCVGRSPAMQESCMQTCQTQNTACFSKGTSGSNAPPRSDTLATSVKPRARAERRQQ